MDRTDQHALLTKGRLEVEGRVAGSSNQALLVSVTLDGASAQACYKPEAGERRLWDFPDGLWRREVAAYELDVVLVEEMRQYKIAFLSVKRHLTGAEAPRSACTSRPGVDRLALWC